MHKLNVVKEVVGKQSMNSDNLFEGSQQGLFRQGVSVVWIPLNFCHDCCLHIF